ncbi:DNA-binding response regulator [Sphingorhabdus lutea]|uniref:Regulatory protein VirG n=1 Tax=Sphingorhabdus lutea TaxID=1913578 RepID=A0A1L3JEM1_9SPHN|nr:response regulator [Sphingorhabdus lutea]APG63591.1 DNA-binding response regulator [Sphingorhabdus lutea]
MQKTRFHILVVDDEPSIRDPLSKYLVKQGFRVSSSESAAVARSMISSYSIDLILLDIMMPEENGLILLREITKNEGPPVILLTAMGEEADRIEGINLGADDYIVKPFSPKELVARINMVLRRIGPNKNEEIEAESLSFNGWTLLLKQQSLIDPDGAEVALSAGEFAMLKILTQRPHQLLSRDQLLDLSKGREAGPLDRSIDNQISRLRKKIEDDPANPQYIKTIWGGGYRWCIDVTMT